MRAAWSTHPRLTLIRSANDELPAAMLASRGVTETPKPEHPAQVSHERSERFVRSCIASQHDW
jgi:hypothetical protein